MAAAPADGVASDQVINDGRSGVPWAGADPFEASNIPLIRTTFARIEPLAGKAFSYFGGLLFTRNPQLRGMFPIALKDHGEHMLGSLTRIVWTLDNPQDLYPYLTALGRAHRKYGVLAEHYGLVAEALLATARAFAGEAWTDAAEAAWRAMLDMVSQIMISGAEQDGRHSPPWWLGEVVGHERRAGDLAVLTVAPDRPLPYLAGQYVHVQSTRWPRVWRPYSIANAPRADGLLDFHVRAIPGGWVSGALVHHTAPGATLLLGCADGTMTARAPSARDALCIAGGTGLAPIKAIVQRLIADEPPGGHRTIRLFFGARSEAGLYDLPALRRMAAAHPALRVTPVVTGARPGDSGPYLRGPLTCAVARHLDDTDHDVYIAGPAGMIRAMVEVLTALGVPPGRISHDVAAITP